MKDWDAYLATDAELRAMVSIARRAAVKVMEVYATDFAVELKGPNDPVTRADREANEIICAALEAAFPDAAIIAEESAPDESDDLAELLQRRRAFFVDPVDGTREFADKNGQFAVMIGMTTEGLASAGVVLAPAMGALIGGRVGVGAFLSRNLDDGAPLGAVEELRVTSLADAKAARAVGSRSHRSPKLATILERLGVTNEVAIGSVALKVARVVQGEADIYVHPSRGAKKWDACAPSAILEAAGGRFTDVTGAAIDFRSPKLELMNGIAATNGVLHDEVIAAARGVYP